MTLGNAKCQKFPVKPWENLQTRCLTPLWQIINTEHMDPSTECSWKQSPPCLRPCRVSEDMNAVSEKIYTLAIQVFGQPTVEIQKRFICELAYSLINYSISFSYLIPKLLEWPLEWPVQYCVFPAVTKFVDLGPETLLPSKIKSQKKALWLIFNKMFCDASFWIFSRLPLLPTTPEVCTPCEEEISLVNPTSASLI